MTHIFSASLPDYDPPNIEVIEDIALALLAIGVVRLELCDICETNHYIVKPEYEKQLPKIIRKLSEAIDDLQNQQNRPSQGEPA